MSLISAWYMLLGSDKFAGMNKYCNNIIILSNVHSASLFAIHDCIACMLSFTRPTSRKINKEHCGFSYFLPDQQVGHWLLYIAICMY